MAQNEKDFIYRLLLLQQYGSEEERAELEERFEDIIDREIGQEPQLPASDEQIKSLFHQTLNTAIYKSELPEFIQSLVEDAKVTQTGGAIGQIIFSRLPFHREISDLRRIPEHITAQKHPKLRIEMDSFYNPTTLRINLCDLTASRNAGQTLEKGHPLYQVAEIELTNSHEGPFSARVGYNTDHEGQIIQPNWDKQRFLWNPMTAPQAKMLSRMLPAA